MSIGNSDSHLQYIGGLWCHQTTGNRWFVILAGAILGLCAALLWAAQVGFY